MIERGGEGGEITKERDDEDGCIGSVGGRGKREGMLGLGGSPQFQSQPALTQNSDASSELPANLCWEATFPTAPACTHHNVMLTEVIKTIF